MSEGEVPELTTDELLERPGETADASPRAAQDSESAGGAGGRSAILLDDRDPDAQRLADAAERLDRLSRRCR